MISATHASREALCSIYGRRETLAKKSVSGNYSKIKFPRNNISDYAESGTPEITDPIVANIEATSNFPPANSPDDSISTSLPILDGETILSDRLTHAYLNQDL